MSIYYIDNDNEDLDPQFDIHEDDPSLNKMKSSPLKNEYRVGGRRFSEIFFSDYRIDYISEYFSRIKNGFRVITYPHETNTCYEKAKILGSWDPLNVIKALCLECSGDQSLYAVVIPETGCFVDKIKIKQKISLPDDTYLFKTKNLPKNMTYGTCSPFISAEDLM